MRSDPHLYPTKEMINMSEGNNGIKYWIKLMELAKRHDEEPFLGVSVRGLASNGLVYVAVFDKKSKKLIRDEVPVTKEDLEKLKALGSLEE